MAIYLRNVNESDKEDILHWRNDPVTREMSITSEVVTSEEHAAWFQKLLENPNQFGFIAVVSETENFQHGNKIDARSAYFKDNLVASETESFQRVIKSARSAYFSQKIGFVRMDRLYGTTFEININVAPEKRGHGFGTLIIKESCQKMVTENGAQQFFARIKSKNERSLKSFLKVGFLQVDVIDEMFILRFTL